MKTEESIKTVQEAVENATSGFIGAPVSTESKEAMVKAVMDGVRHLLPKPEPVKCSILWDTMTTMEKFKWWIANRVFPSFASTVRQQNLAMQVYRDRLDTLTFGYADMHFGTPYLRPPALPKWANADPHSVMILDMAFTLPVPVDTIKFDAILFDEAFLRPH